MHRQKFLAAIALALLVVAGCPPETPAPTTPECQSAADCVDLADDIGRLCTDGKCTACQQATECEADGRYGTGAVCVAGLCTTCVDSEVGCACLGGQYCVEGAGCQDSVCQPCARGSERCACNQDGSCGEGLVCQTDRCVASSCTAGADGCPCDNGDCQDDLVCGEGVCRSCPADVEGCPCEQRTCGVQLVCDGESRRCRAATSCSELVCGSHRMCGQQSGQYHCLDECETGFRWNSNTQVCEAISHANCVSGAEASILADCTSQHRDCIEEIDSAHCGACIASSECWIGPADPTQGSCRAPVTCTDCTAQHRGCSAATGCGDATCGTCVTGYHAQGTDCVPHTYTTCTTCDNQHRTCESDAGGDYCGACLPFWHDNGGACVSVPNCTPGAENSIAEQCASDHRDCIEGTALDEAHCGNCLSGYTEDTVAQVCVSTNRCDSDADCPTASGYHCIQLDVADDAYCQKTQCTGGAVWDRFNHRCMTCPLTCPAGSGLTGTIWPVTDRNGNCYCETTDGFFWDASTAGGTAFECDKDGDGWVNQVVYQILASSLREYGAQQDDWTPVINARCHLLEVSNFVLVNEWNQQLVLEVATEFNAINGGRPSVTLYETTRNDRDDQVVLPTYGGRRFTPAEVNSLTKACINQTADVNHNTIADVGEDQNASSGDPWQQVFNKVSFFAELYRGYFDNGTYYIVERSRCNDQEFALAYNQLDPGVAQAGDYWRSCTRRRDHDYSGTQPIGYDFAQYACGRDVVAECLYGWSGGWGVSTQQFAPDPPVAPQSFSAIEPHGVCDQSSVETLPWRGMNQYSQFHCAVPKTAPTAPYEIAIADISYVDGVGSFVPGKWHLDVCGLGSNSGTFTCTQPVDQTTVDSTLDQVVWLALRYQDYASADGYAGGCINEWVEWRQLCPGYLESSDPANSIRGFGRPNAFGQLACGCDFNYGGRRCDLGCPDPHVHYSSGYDPSTRVGTWLCGDIAASSTPYLSDGVDGGYTMRGAIPAHATATAALCQTVVDGGECAEAGYAIRPLVLP